MKLLTVVCLVVLLSAVADASDIHEQLWQAYAQRSDRQKALDRQAIERELGPAGLRRPTPAPAGSNFANLVRDQPDAWYESEEAARIADIVVSFQTASGGWSKGIDFTAGPRQPGQTPTADRNGRWMATFDNGATINQLYFLARIYRATQNPTYRDAFLRGLEYIHMSQYPNGGFPQVYPLEGGYHDLITFNDDVMVNVLRLLKAVAEAAKPFDFLDPDTHRRAREAFDLGIQCILDTQIIVEGRPTAWAQQYHPRSLAPEQARSYELPAITPMESAAVLQLLMDIDHPSPQVVQAVHAAVQWLERVKFENTQMIDVPHNDPNVKPDHDRVVKRDPQFGPTWARFYQIGSDRPMFVGRDGVIRHDLREIEHERRIGYRWYTNRPQAILDRQYPQWKKRLDRLDPPDRP